MKTRILDSLDQFRKSTKSDLFTAILSELELDPQALQQMAQIRLKQLLHNYAFFDISTIDKFNHRLIRTFARDLKLPQNFEVVIETDLLLEEAVENLIARAGYDQKLTGVLIDFALEKIGDDKSWDITFDLKNIGKLIFEENHQEPLKHLEGRSMDDFLNLKVVLLRTMRQIKEDVVKLAQEILVIIAENGLEDSDFSSGYFPKFIKKIQSGDLQFDYQTSWKDQFDMLPLYAKKCPDTIKATLDTLHPEFNRRFQHIKSESMRYAFLRNIYNNLVPLTVLSAIQEEIRFLREERDLLPISAFNQIISKEIKSQPAPFIYERLGEKYRHDFVDEFQDTSELQWTNLIPLFSNALEGEDARGRQGSVILVGDAKQAIYRWRGGRAEQFLDLSKGLSHPFVVAPEVKNLEVNRRSHEEIIHFSNDFFTLISPLLENPSYAQMFKEGNRQESNFRKGGLVQIDFLEDNGEAVPEAYGRKVIEAVRLARNNKFSYSDICILTRNRAHGILLSGILIEEGIPIISSETLLLNSDNKIRFLIGLLTYSVHPEDAENRYQLLYFLTENNLARHEYLRTKLEFVSRALLEEYAFDIEFFKRSTVYDGLEYAIKQFSLAGNSDAYLTYFLDEVFAVEQKTGSGVFTFLNYWDEKKEKLSIVAPEGLNAVQIMTIHKSKGLEFPIVIFPFANTPVRDSKNSKLWVSLDMENPQGFKEVLISKKKEVSGYNAIVARKYEEEEQKLELDAFNVLYVALTRAISGLFIITEKDLKKNGSPMQNYARLFIYYLQQKGLWSDTQLTYSMGALPDSTDMVQEENSERTIPFIYSHRNNPLFRILTVSGMLWDSNRSEAISRGNLIHHLMSLIHSKDDLPPALDEMRLQGLLTPGELIPLRDMALRIMSHPLLKTSYQKGPIIRNESDIITQNGLLLRPDRIVIRESKVTVIDYKTGNRNSLYSRQIEAYATALREMGFEIEDKIIVYIGTEAIDLELIA